MKKSALRSFARRSLGALWGARELNSFVYNACLRAGIKWPDIPVKLVEFYGQFGEDLIVRSLLEAKAENDGFDLKNGGCLEIGGNHPFATSATFLLCKQLGMTGVVVEANPKLIPDLEKGRPNDTVIHAAVQDKDVKSVTLSLSKLSEISSLDRNFVLHWPAGNVGEIESIDVPAARINQIIEKYFDGVTLCFLSIDVEGLDLVLLKDLDFNSYRPWLIQVEQSDHYFPESSVNISKHMQSVNYGLIARTGPNLIFTDLGNRIF
jgi:FkbM family methyltransferase